jgi:hypothetical protein
MCDKREQVTEMNWENSVRRIQEFICRLSETEVLFV